jgi:hypothetical protein
MRSKTEKSHKPNRPIPIYDHLDRRVGAVGIHASEGVVTRFLGPNHNGATYNGGAWYGNPPKAKQQKPPRGGGPAVSSLNHRDSVIAALNNAVPLHKSKIK